jgi:uncharacterized protein YecE (DUF72 family)
MSLMKMRDIFFVNLFMDFGLVPPELIPEVDFTLPPDTELTKEVLRLAGKESSFNVYVGCAKWDRKEWVGMIYPEKIKEADFLDEYVRHFNSIELNALFYKMHSPEQISKWREKAANVRRDFKFCPKVTQWISHRKRLKGAEELTGVFLSRIAHFGEYLGPAFLQLPDNFGPKNIDILQEYLQGLPGDLDLFVELRHKDWFINQEASTRLFETMRKRNTGAVITDTSGRRDCVHMQLTIPRAFIRFVGNGLHESDFRRIDEWAERLAEWKEQGLEALYFFLHQHDESDTPILADYAVQKFNERLAVRLEAPHFLRQTGK